MNKIEVLLDSDNSTMILKPETFMFIKRIILDYGFYYEIFYREGEEKNGICGQSEALKEAEARADL